jgi:hypothetical protein
LGSQLTEVRANAAAALKRLGRAPAQLAALVDDPDPSIRANAARAPSASDLKDAHDWVAIQLTDYDGAPLGDGRFRMILPGGLHKLGRANERGRVFEGTLPKGDVELQLNRDPD